MAARISLFLGLLGLCVLLGCSTESGNLSSRQIKLLKEDNQNLAVERDAWRNRAQTAESKLVVTEKLASDLKGRTERMQTEQTQVRAQLHQLRSNLQELLVQADATMAALDSHKADHDEFLTESRNEFGITELQVSTNRAMPK